MDNRYFRLLDSRGLASEDDTSLALAELVRASLDIRRLFLRFLFGKVPASVLSRIDELVVIPQYSFTGSTADVESLGRIDLALLLPEMHSIIGIEFKVRDREKPGRLKNYRIVINHGFRGSNWLFEVVQRPEHAIDTAIVDRVLTWNGLYETLSHNIDEIEDVKYQSALREYLEFLALSKTILSDGVPLRRAPRRYIGVPEENVCRSTFLDLAKRLPAGITSSVESDKNVPPQLRLGRDKWASKFGMLWVQRIWLNLRTDAETEKHFIRSSIIFHNANFTKFEYAARMLPQWAPICSEAGFAIWRGPASGWDGKKSVQLHRPWILDCRPKYFTAQEAEAPLSRAAARSDGSLDWLFDDILKRLPNLLDLVDKFPI
ncbi:MAG: hypothetical protein M3128_00950 [Verrucomicrobiota bacterium]|nr:hypothetical protein [Verrucomicrobiota bacterium]